MLHTVFVEGFGTESLIRGNLFFFFFFLACLFTFRIHSKDFCFTRKLQTFIDPKFDSGLLYITLLSHSSKRRYYIK